MITLSRQKICVMGLGTIGIPVALHIQSKHFPVHGYDITQNAIEHAIELGIPSANTLRNDDIYVVTVNTGFRNGMSDMSAIEDCCQYIHETNPDALICFESTLTVGSSRQMAEQYRFQHVVVCPHRWWEKDQVNHGVVQPRVIGALNAESMALAVEFYSTLDIPLFQVSSLEIAELSKLVENTHRYLQIAYVEELKLMCDTHNFDFEELRMAVNTKWNVDLLEARDGIGGVCLPKDIRYLKELFHAPTPLLDGAIRADEAYTIVHAQSHAQRRKKKTKRRLPIPNW